MKTVHDVMTRDPITIDPDAPLGTAMAVMREQNLRHLPVVDDAGTLVGMITDRDLRTVSFAPAFAEHLSAEARRRLRGLSEGLEQLRVRDAMTWEVVTIGADAPVARAAAVMCEKRLGSLPVVSAGRLVGIITERDVLRELAATLPSVQGVDPGRFLW